MVRLRLILVSVLLLAASAVGAISSLLVSGGASAVSGPTPEIAQAFSRLSVRPLVADLVETGIFPVANAPNVEGALAQTHQGTDQTGVESPSQIQPEMQLPGVAALVRREQAWSIFVNGVEHRSEQVSVGDELYDGWVLDEIAAAHFKLRRGSEVREIHVFTTEGGP